MYNFTFKLMYQTLDDFSINSGCMLPCTVYEYTSKKYTTSNSHIKTLNGSSFIGIMPGKLGMTIIKETYLYDEFSLIGEIGGSLGHFLGFSCVSLFDFVKTIRLSNTCKKNKGLKITV